MGRNEVCHWLFVGGLSLVALAGLLLAVALWPWRAGCRTADKDHAHTPGMLDLEQAAFFTVSVTSLGLAAFGAVAGAYMGHGLEPLFAEDLVRAPTARCRSLPALRHYLQLTEGTHHATLGVGLAPHRRSISMS